MTLDSFNSAARDDAAALVRPCLDIARWVDALVDGRPYPDIAAAADAALTAAAPFTEAEIDGALAHHPRIGERPTGHGAEANLARSEQSGVDASAAEALAVANRAYEDRFDRVFLIRAAGRSADDVLAAIAERLGNTLDHELVVIEQQLREIAALRLEGALA
jgi:2-oxo-4-hydroxy-4-carboxy-5-ureidoimidazoline decarboxylase